MTVLVIKADVIAAGFCAAGMREWCRLNGFGAADIRQGIPADLLMNTGCDLAARVVDQAVRRQAAQTNEAPE